MVVFSLGLSCGSTLIKMPMAIKEQMIIILSHATFLDIQPAINLPKANETAKIAAIFTLKLSENEKIFSLNLGNQVMIPCSIITKKNAEKMKTKTKGKAINFAEFIKSSFRFFPEVSMGAFILENNRSTKEMAIMTHKTG